MNRKSLRTRKMGATAADSLTHLANTEHAAQDSRAHILLRYIWHTHLPRQTIKKSNKFF